MGGCPVPDTRHPLARRSPGPVARLRFSPGESGKEPRGALVPCVLPLSPALHPHRSRSAPRPPLAAAPRRAAGMAERPLPKRCPGRKPPSDMPCAPLPARLLAAPAAPLRRHRAEPSSAASPHRLAAGGRGGNGLPPRCGRLRPGPLREALPLPWGWGKPARRGIPAPWGGVSSVSPLWAAGRPAGGRGFAETCGRRFSRGWGTEGPWLEHSWGGLRDIAS